MYRQLLVIAALLAVNLCNAQVSMTLQVPPTGVLLKKQLWNMAIVYTGDNSIFVRINLTLSSASGNDPLLTASTPSFSISKGVKQVQPADIAPIQYQYLSSAIADRDPDGFLPAGAYQACYTIILSDEQNSTPLAEDCISFEVEALSPPMLNTPADADTLQTKFPQFTWLPPTPLNLFSNLSYWFNLVEVQSGQNPADALQQNIPIYSNHNCTDVFINYTPSNISLDTGKLYAWQVVAQNNLQPSAQSEVWTFRVIDSNFILPPANNNYIVLSSGSLSSGAYVIEGHSIGIKYYSFDKAHDADVKLTRSDGTIIKIMRERIGYGDNYLNYALNNSFQKGQTYYIEVTDLRNNKFGASFRIK